MSAMLRTLMKAIIDLAAFLELSDDDVVRLDAAVDQLDALSNRLSELSRPDAEAFAQFIRQQIVEEERGLNRANYVTFLQSFAEELEEPAEEDVADQ